MSSNRATRCLLVAGLAFFAALSVSGCASGPATSPKATTTQKFSFWPLSPDEPRIQFLGAFNSSEDVAPVQTSALESVVFGKESVSTAFVNKPYGLAFRDGKVYVCDIRAKAVLIMDLAKKQTRVMGVTGSTRLQRPIAVAAGEDGSLYVADSLHAAILVYDSNERFSRSFEIDKLKPASLAIFGNRLYVADMFRQNVLVLDAKSGSKIGEIGTVGDEDGQFRLPIGVAVDKKGDLYVADMMRCRVQKFSPDGKFLGGFGELGDKAGGFARPKHLAVDSDGIIYVVDAAFQNVQMFNDKFQLLMHFGSMGDFPGSMNLPAGIAVADSGWEPLADRVHPGFAPKRVIVVANQFGDGKVSIYTLGDRKPSHTVAEIAASSNKVGIGVGKPSAESLKFQNIGGVEPPPEGMPTGPATQEPAKDAPATK